MNFLEREMKKGLFKEAEKAWDQNKGKFGMKTGKPAAPAPAPATQPPPPPTPQEGEEATAEGEQPPPPYPVGAPARAPAPQASSAAAGVPPLTVAAQASAAAGAAPQPAKKQTLQEKLLAKVGEKVGDPAMQAKAEKLLKTKAKRTLFKF